MEHSVAVRFDNVSFAYNDYQILDRASFHIHAKEFATLVGPNGAGKTTVLKLILGLLKPQSGTVTIFDKDIASTRNKIGYVPQNANFDAAFPISVIEVVRQGRLTAKSLSIFSHINAKIEQARKSEEAVAKAMEIADITAISKRPYFALSGGQRRRVLVARALAAEPDLLILDEPTANMDEQSEERVYKTLAMLKGNTTILIVTHDTSFVSSLTDAVFCVGSHGSKNHIVKHRTETVNQKSPNNIGGILEVLHNTEMPDDFCCKTSK